MPEIRSHAANNAYRDGWERIFAKKTDWTHGKTVLQIRAIQDCASGLGILASDIVENEKLWKPYLHKIN